MEKNEVVLLAGARLIIVACTEAGLAGWMLKHRGEEASLAHDEAAGILPRKRRLTWGNEAEPRVSTVQ